MEYEKMNILYLKEKDFAFFFLAKALHIYLIAPNPKINSFSVLFALLSSIDDYLSSEARGKKTFTALVCRSLIEKGGNIREIALLNLI